MRISDWSSDVCSSDLFDRVPAVGVASRMDDEKPVGRGDIDARCEKLVAQRAIIFGRTKLGDEPLIKEIRRCIYSLYKRCPRCDAQRSEEHTSELQSLMRISYAVFCLKKKINLHTLII